MNDIELLNYIFNEWITLREAKFFFKKHDRTLISLAYASFVIETFTDKLPLFHTLNGTITKK